MDDYINRNNAIKGIEDEVIRIAKMLPDSENTRNLIKGAKDSIDTLKHMPSADVVEQKHGHWIHKIISASKKNKMANVLYECLQ